MATQDYTYRCTGVTMHGETQTTELKGWEAESMADAWMRSVSAGQRFAYAVVIVVDSRGNRVDARSEYYRPRK